MKVRGETGKRGKAERNDNARTALEFCKMLEVGRCAGKGYQKWPTMLLSACHRTQPAPRSGVLGMVSSASDLPDLSGYGLGKRLLRHPWPSLARRRCWVRWRQVTWAARLEDVVSKS